MTRHLCSKIKDFSPCLPGQVLDFSIFSIHKYKIFLLITFFKIFANDWVHMGNKYTNVAIKCQCAQSFLNILKKVINKKILYLCIEIMLKSSFYSVAFNFFGPSLLNIHNTYVLYVHPRSGLWTIHVLCLKQSCVVHNSLRIESRHKP